MLQSEFRGLFLWIEQLVKHFSAVIWIKDGSPLSRPAVQALGALMSTDPLEVFMLIASFKTYLATFHLLQTCVWKNCSSAVWENNAQWVLQMLILFHWFEVNGPAVQQSRWVQQSSRFASSPGDCQPAVFNLLQRHSRCHWNWARLVSAIKGKTLLAFLT